MKDTHRHDGTPGDRAGPDPLARLRVVIAHTAHLLPAQGPIAVFIHHNPLHAFEDLPFDQAVEHGTKIFGFEPYLPEDRYRDALGTGRVRSDDLRAALEDDLGTGGVECVARLVTRLDLRLAMLQYSLRGGSAEEIRWFIAQTDALRVVNSDTSAAARRKVIAETRRWVMRDLRAKNKAGTDGSSGHPGWLAELFEQFGESRIETWDERSWEAFTLEALWRVCGDGVRGVPAFAPPGKPPIRHRDLLVRVTGVDTDRDVNGVLIRFCAAFVDQGVAHWPLPEREKGFFHAFASLYRRPGGPPDRWMQRLPAELSRLQESGVTPLESIRESLAALGTPDPEWETFIGETLLALRGWGGIIRHMETHGDRVARSIPDGSLTEFLAVRLLLERVALTHAAKESLGYTGPLAGLRDELRRRLALAGPPGEEQRAFVVFQLAQVLGWSPDALHRLPPDDWSALVEEIEAFIGVERRRVFHLAYEKRFREQTLDALTLHAQRPTSAPARPRFQAVTCLDEREESFRRHLEEVAPDCETFAAAGFYGVAMYYRGAADAHFVPLCPIVIRPRHWVEEQPDDTLGESHERQRKARRALGTASHKVHVGTRGFLAGALLTAGVGVLASIPLVVRTLFPRLAARFRGRLSRLVHSHSPTRLRLERTEPEPGPENGRLGYTLDEMTDIAERQLRDIGLTSNLARLVLVLGHGSHSMNNPHESAHDCGACGGSIGGANARALAQMLNDPRVRDGLAKRGLAIPADTAFVGALHNTCNEYVKVFDGDRLPDTHQEVFEQARRAIEQALGRNAHERARRFESAPLTLSFESARKHMDARAEDLAQVRPEWGHATNAICIVGRRQRTRGLYLDRRAFLASYDPTQDDPETAILARLLAAAVPVCAGINLEYYFCRVDPVGWGCGTKLPHNITSLVGVMDGAASDLRTGLPWQMVEIHEPVRLLFVVETTTDAMLKIMARNEVIGRLVRNGWVQMAVLDPHSARVHLFQRGAFVPYLPRAAHLPAAASSVDWYRGWRDHLEFAEIGK